MADRHRHIATTAGGLALLALTVGVLWPAAHGAFVFDDKSFIAHNPLIAAPDGLRRLWTTTESLDYWPLSFSVFWVAWRLFGADTLGYHLLAMALHALVAFLLWRLVVALRLLPPWLAWLAAALFCLHPVNVEAGAWIFQIRTTFATALALGAALVWVRFARDARSWRYALSLGLFTLALLAKSSVASLPLAGLVAVAAGFGRQTEGHAIAAPSPRRLWLSLLPYLALAALLCAVDLRVTSLHPAESDAIRTDGLVSRALGAARALWFYLGKDAWPAGLDVVYPKWPLGWSATGQLAAAVALAALVAALVALRRTWSVRITLVALALFAAVLLPCLGFVNISFMRHTYVADHWQYPAIAIPVVWALMLGARFLRWAPFVAAAGGAALLACAVASHERSQDFRDQETFWRAALTNDPESKLARLTLATLEDEAGKTAEAKEQYLRLIGEPLTDPADATLVGGAHYNLGALLAERGNPDEAAVHYEEAARILHDVPEVQENLGALLSRVGRHADAVAAWRRAVQLAPDSAVAQAGLGEELTRFGDAPGAEAALAAAIRLDPNAPVYHADLGLVRLALGQRDAAAAEIAAALRLGPTEPAAVVAGCRLYLAEGKKDEALALAEHAQREALARGQQAQADQISGFVRELGGP